MPYQINTGPSLAEIFMMARQAREADTRSEMQVEAQRQAALRDRDAALRDQQAFDMEMDNRRSMDDRQRQVAQLRRAASTQDPAALQELATFDPNDPWLLGLQKAQVTESDARKESEKAAYEKQQDADKFRLDERRVAAAERAAGSPTTVINTGDAGETYAPVGRKTQSDQESIWLQGQETMAMLDDIENTARDDNGNVNFSAMLGFLPKAERWTLDTASKIDPRILSGEQQTRLAQLADFRTIVDKFRAEEFKRLVGSAQTASEVKNLTNSILNADMSSPQFTAAFGNLRRITSRAMRVAEEVLSKGIRIGSIEYSKAMDAGMKAAKESELDERAYQLEQSGMPDDMVMQTLVSEGYITKKQAQSAMGGR